jgi:hypothetical protein
VLGKAAVSYHASSKLRSLEIINYHGAVIRKYWVRGTRSSFSGENEIYLQRAIGSVGLLSFLLFTTSFPTYGSYSNIELDSLSIICIKELTVANHEFFRTYIKGNSSSQYVATYIGVREGKI